MSLVPKTAPPQEMHYSIQSLERAPKKKTAEAVFQTSGDNCNAVKAVSACAIMRRPYFPLIGH